ncbi:unnamed protein product [Bursaphelenchus okinawaensis]|uniref:Piwi domain-containing protein n=1 Tax=Bursaphelenchus okinawaensis TaxID=465554 RepID=A0A811LGX7_9BILA|nr:unnamed protein product [Bursaphelenchus okinawaensis]CAG9123607.1 unnamed protein product [Bursaphelenchus okinawaensis]
MASLSKQMAAMKVDRKKVSGKSTVFEMSLKPGNKVYRYDVEITLKRRTLDKVLTKQSDPGLKIYQRGICYEVIEYLHRQNKISKYVYDGKRMLFLLSSLNKNVTETINSTLLSPDTSAYCRKQDLVVEIIPNARVPVFNFTDLTTSISDSVREQADHSARQFLEVLTSQYLVNTGNYDIISSGSLFNTETYEMVPGMQLRVGLSKGVRVTEHNGKLRPLLVADMRRTAFIATKNMLQLYKEFRNNNNEFTKFFRGVRCFGTHRAGFNFTVIGLTHHVISNPECNLEKGLTIPQYYKQTYNVDLTPNVVGLIAELPKIEGKHVVIPLDLAVPLSGQLVPAEKINEQAIRKLVSENSVNPDIRYQFVLKQVNEIANGNGGKFLNDFGVTVNTSSNDIDIFQRQGLTLMAGANRTIRPMPNGSFMNDATGMKLYQTANKLTKWWVIGDIRATNDRQVKEYMGYLMKTAAAAGLNLPQPALVQLIEFDQLEVVFQKAAAQGVLYIFYIDESRTKSHSKLKLFEAYYKVLTQQVITKNLENKPQTLKNVVMKINAKTFGVNYMPVFPATLKAYDLNLNKDLMVIGYDVAHPAPASPQEKKNAAKEKSLNPFDAECERGPLKSLTPSVVGLCANAGPNPLIFGGDFFYQESRRENVENDKLRKHVSFFAERAKKVGRQIKRVLIVRDGISEGQLEYAVKNELPAIKKAFSDAFGPQSNIKFTFVVATKMHNKRFYEFVNGQIQNTKVGDVIDSKVVRTDITEFYLQSHHPLKGVPKMTQYCNIANELQLTNDQLQGLMQILSSMHQVCACPTSLPLPVYMAHELAKRGNDIYKAYNLLPEDHEIKRKVAAGLGPLKDFTAVTNHLGYAGHPLSSTRFNA